MSPKAGRLAVLANRFDAERRAIGVYTPVEATVGLVSKLINLSTLFPPDQDELTHGINPFLFGLTTPSQAAQMAQRAHLYQTLFASGGAPTLSDVVTLEADDSVRVATDVTHLGPSLDGCRVALSALLGRAHPMVLSLHAFRTDVERHMHVLSHRQLMQPTIAAEIQRYVQVSLRQWFLLQGDADHQVATTLEPQAVAHAAMGRMGWGYELPPSIKAPTVRQAPTATPSAGRSPAEPNPRRREPGSNQIVRRADGVTALFQAVSERPGVRSRDVRDRCQRDKVPIPTNSAGGTRCLPFHLRGQCNTNCANAEDHRADHSADEEQELLTWAQKHWAQE